MNLVKVASISRAVIKGLLIFTIVYTTFRYTKPYIKRAALYINPTDTPPNPVFGLLPPLEFTEAQYSGNPKFSLSTPQERLPSQQTQRVRVYEYLPHQFSFEAGRIAQRQASYLGFKDEYLTSDLKGNIFTWRNPFTQAILSINSQDNSLFVSTPLSTNNTSYKFLSFNEELVINDAKGLLSALGHFNHRTYTNGTQIVHSGVIRQGQVVSADAGSLAQLAKVSFLRKANNRNVYNPNYYLPSNYVWVGYPTDSQEPVFPIIKWKAPEINIQENRIGIYPIIPVQLAWEEVQKGNGVITGVLPNNLSPLDTYSPPVISQVFINQIELAYYENLNQLDYLQPIYVFKGKYNVNNRPGGNIVIYYPAISGQFIRSPEAENTTEEAQTQSEEANTQDEIILDL